MNYGMRKHIVFNSCLKTVLTVYIACRNPSIITLNTIVGTVAVREQSFMYMILYGQGSRKLETYLPTSDSQVTISQAEFLHISITFISNLTVKFTVNISYLLNILL